ncbi:hypothetical protein [Streptomyces sp. WM6378]|uniref:flagellin N-terminal helical domain-containing protein n=1 Tax=Streptomyces sp. WM6378 TaxID=1415557 RepID=UPI0006AFB60A|nr:hypothetical protein [Streptomyces sp. WM6378]KOU50577.1 hypothetical protein ADK54_09640 [Streptomyces sp. WM6378]
MVQILNTNALSLITQNNLEKSHAALSNAIESLSSGMSTDSAHADAAGMTIASRSDSAVHGVPSAVVYTEPLFEGNSQILAPGRYDSSDLTIPDDSISSVIVPTGLRVTLFEHAGFTGEETVIQSDTDALGAIIDGTASAVVVEMI